MSKDLTLATAKLPAHLQGADNATKEFTGGVQSGFPVMSIRGRVWRVKTGGEEQVYSDDNGDAVSSVELVLVKSVERPSKIHYDKKYEEGDDGKPRCFSADGITPSNEVDAPIHPTCQGCPKNQWGSRITENGKKSRACSDVRRIAVVTLAQITEALEKDQTPVPMLLRIPPASLNPLKEYAGDVLGKKGIQPYMMVSRLGFDNEADYPKITFKPARFLSPDEYALVTALRASDEVARILQTSEYSSEGTPVSDEAAVEDRSPSPAAEARPAPSESSKPATQKPVSAKLATPKPATPKPATPKPAKKREATAAEAEAAAAAAATVVEPEEAEPVVASEPVIEQEESGDEDFEAMLNNILGN